jgi:uncharacterized repeat protein (TIGR01451 family)
MRTKLKKAIQLITIIVIGILMVATVVAFARKSSERVLAAGPIPPPEGYPKLSLSTKVVTPTLAAPGATGAVLTYSIDIVNTGAYPATDVTLVDAIPNHTTYLSSKGTPPPVLTGGVLRWEHGTVGFDTSVAITFSVQVEPGYEGLITNTAVINDPAIASPVTVTAETRTDPLSLRLQKAPALPGKNNPLFMSCWSPMWAGSRDHL